VNGVSTTLPAGHFKGAPPMPNGAQRRRGKKGMRPVAKRQEGAKQDVTSGGSIAPASKRKTTTPRDKTMTRMVLLPSAPTLRGEGQITAVFHRKGSGKKWDGVPGPTAGEGHCYGKKACLGTG